MQRYYRTPFIAVIALLLVCTSTLTIAQESSMGKTLILYYSRTGNTKMCCGSPEKRAWR